jgi:hypothetical protein
VADADEAFGEQMQQEAPQDLIQRRGHQLLYIVVSRVPPTKGNLAVGQRDQSMVGNGYAMGVAAQVLEHIVGAAEGWFGVNDPSLFGTAVAATQRRSWVVQAEPDCRKGAVGHAQRPT